MNTFLYVVLAVMGTIFGSFFTLAVYRIPRKENIVYVRSHCTSCNHRLEFWDLIPVLSYIFLGGKCRYCKESIRPRYLLLELLSGLVFVLIALAMNISVESTMMEFITYAYTVLIVSVLCILMGIGKNICYSVVIFGMIIRTLYFVFLDIAAFSQFFIETALFIIVALIVYLCMNKYYSSKCKDDMYFEKNYPYAIQTIMFVGFLIYVFGINIVLAIMIFAIIAVLIVKCIIKRNVDYIMYISFISIIMLICISNIDLYAYILNIF